MKYQRQIKLHAVLLLCTILLGAGILTLGKVYFSRNPGRSAVELSQNSLTIQRAVLGKEASAEIKLKNNGSSPLHINKILPSCSCTSANMEARNISPGKEVPISVSINAHGGLRPGNVGYVRLECQVENEETFFVDIPVHVQRVVGLITVPTLVDFGTVHNHQLPSSRKLHALMRVASTEDVDMSCSAARDWISIKEDSDQNTPGKASYEISLMPNAPEGRFTERLHIEGTYHTQDGQEYMETWVTVTGMIKKKNN